VNGVCGLRPVLAWLLVCAAFACAADEPAPSVSDAPPGVTPGDSTPVTPAPAKAPDGSVPAGERWAIVHADSVASFRVRVFGVLPIGGEFATLDGALVLDRPNALARVEATIASGSVTMGNPSHAEWARSPEFFDAVAHPEIRFVSRPLPFATIASGGTLRGKLSLRGITRDVAFALAPSGCDLMHAVRCTVSVFGSVARSQFGMVSRPRTLNDRVSLRFTITAAPDAPVVPAAAHPS
jgi:polyisoprenoid-binding protein YceI